MNRMVIAIIIALIGLILLMGCTTNSTTSVQPSNPTTVVVVTNDVTPIPTIVQPSNPTTVIVVKDVTSVPTLDEPSNPPISTYNVLK